MPEYTKRRAEDRIPMMGLLSGAPWWVRVLIFILFMFLGPSILAAFLLLAAFGIIDSPILETNAMVQRIRAGEIRQTRVLRVLCRRVSKTEAHITECDDALRPPSGSAP